MLFINIADKEIEDSNAKTHYLTIFLQFIHGSEGPRMPKLEAARILIPNYPQVILKLCEQSWDSEEAVFSKIWQNSLIL